MSQCVQVNGTTGALEPSTASPCTSFVMLTPDEYSSLVASPLNLSAEDGATLSVAILGVWAVAWSFKALVKALNVDGEVNE